MLIFETINTINNSDVIYKEGEIDPVRSKQTVTYVTSVRIILLLPIYHLSNKLYLFQH